MTCIICGRRTEKADIWRGPYCSETHYQKMLEDERRLHAIIMAEPGSLLPETFDVEALEHLALRIALEILDRVAPDEGFPACQVALVVKERLVEHLPAGYLSRLPGEGPARSFVNPSYKLRTKIPREVVRTALEKAHFFRLVN